MYVLDTIFLHSLHTSNSSDENCGPLSEMSCSGRQWYSSLEGSHADTSPMPLSLTLENKLHIAGEVARISCMQNCDWDIALHLEVNYYESHSVQLKTEKGRVIAVNFCIPVEMYICDIVLFIICHVTCTVVLQACHKSMQYGRRWISYSLS